LLLIAGFWLNRVLERFKDDLATARQGQQRISEAQFKLYTGLWSHLQNLKIAGDGLWRKCAPETLTPFVTALSDARLATSRGQLILREEHHERLQGILVAFGQFELGKMHLLEIQTEQHLQNNLFGMNELERQIQANREYKNQYERLLDKILPEFRRHLGVAAEGSSSLDPLR